MAWRIEEQVVRGEIDNRTRGLVTGRIWLIGRPEPVVLRLEGNAWRDLAGRRLEFVNPKPLEGEPRGLESDQTGVVGDCTASRKVRVPDVSKEEFEELYKQRKPFPWHWANSLYLEWFSLRNGRVVIESADYQLKVTDGPTWEMTAAEELEQRKANGEALVGFMDRLTELVAEGQDASEESADDEAPDEEAADEEDEAASFADDRPLTEEEAEAMQDESDLLSDRIHARMEREGPDADLEKIIEEELERRRAEKGEKPLSPEEEAARDAWIDDVSRAAEEAMSENDPELEAEIRRKHPLAERAFELSVRLFKEPEAKGWLAEDVPPEHPLLELITKTSQASAKLAGALNGNTWPPEVDSCAGKIVRLKRARGYIDDALAGAADSLEQKLAPTRWLKKVVKELEAIGGECDELIAELRARLEGGR